MSIIIQKEVIIYPVPTMISYPFKEMIDKKIKDKKFECLL